MPHEQFNFKLDYNLAALKLKRKIEFDDFVQQICLPDIDTKVADGDVGKVSKQKKNFKFIMQGIEIFY